MAATQFFIPSAIGRPLTLSEQREPQGIFKLISYALFFFFLLAFVAEVAFLSKNFRR